MIEFTMEVNEALRIGDDIRLIVLKRDPEYLRFHVARIGIDAPKEISIKQASDICL